MHSHRVLLLDGSRSSRVTSSSSRRECSALFMFAKLAMATLIVTSIASGSLKNALDMAISAHKASFPKNAASANFVAVSNTERESQHLELKTALPVRARQFSKDRETGPTVSKRRWSLNHPTMVSESAQMTRLPSLAASKLQHQQSLFYSPFFGAWNNSIMICAVMKRENITDVIEWLDYHRCAATSVVCRFYLYCSEQTAVC